MVESKKIKNKNSFGLLELEMADFEKNGLSSLGVKRESKTSLSPFVLQIS
jgi:hypothetical protein